MINENRAYIHQVRAFLMDKTGRCKMTIKLLGTQDTQQLEEYLAPYKSECMFICSNLKASGIEYKDAAFHGEYWGSFDTLSGHLNGVIAHYWNGNIMMYASDETILGKLVSHFKNNANRPIAGILGPNTQAEYVITNLGLSSAQYNVNRCEKLYDIDLKDFKTIEIPNPFKMIQARETPLDFLTQWMGNYEVEALGAPKDSELLKRAQIKADRLREKDAWVLTHNDVPVSLSAFNARVDDIVQVGPVWTPPEHRNKGFARSVLAHTLSGEKRKGTKKAILFTDNPAAIKAYQAIGFKNIGHYRLALLKNPVHLRG
jgi:RimJ/RimL family protein N-acetyltransferase